MPDRCAPRRAEAARVRPGSVNRSGENCFGPTSPSIKAIAVQYGKLWSAVSRVAGAHRSGPLPMICTAASKLFTTTRSIASGSPTSSRSSQRRLNRALRVVFGRPVLDVRRLHRECVSLGAGQRSDVEGRFRPPRRRTRTRPRRSGPGRSSLRRQAWPPAHRCAPSWRTRSPSTSRAHRPATGASPYVPPRRSPGRARAAQSKGRGGGRRPARSKRIRSRRDPILGCGCSPRRQAGTGPHTPALSPRSPRGRSRRRPPRPRAPPPRLSLGCAGSMPR